MKILQKIKEWKLNRPESQWSKKKLAIAGAALVVAVGLVIGGKHENRAGRHDNDSGICRIW